MSGIFGFFLKDGAPADPADLRAMEARMTAWGQAAGHLATAGPIGLGHVRHEDPVGSAGPRQPYSDPAAPHLIIAADAKLDNRDELCAALSLSGPECGALSDVVLIVLAFRRWGPDCVTRLSGAFAFVVWDEQERQLFCARDHMGFRPFFYFDAGDRFVFGTDVTAVLAAPSVPRKLDHQMLLADLLLNFRMQRDRSCFDGIAKLPAAHGMTVTSQATGRRQWWHPDSNAAIRLKSNDDYAEALREQVKCAVARALGGGGQAGAHLSGGLDSSAVAVLAARRLRAEDKPRLRAYSWSPPPDIGDAERDERALIRLVCEQEGLSCRYTQLTPEDFADYMSRDVSVDPASTMLHEIRVCEAAAADGVRVLLSGWGGDEFAAFNGRGFFAEKLARLDLLTLARETRALAKSQGARAWRQVARQASAPLAPDWLFRLFGQDASPIARLLSHSGVRLDDVAAGAADIVRDKWTAGRERRGVRRMQSQLYENGHLTIRIEAWARLGAQHGLTYQYPLLDRRLIEFCLALPSEMYFQQGWKRFLFRYAADFLPDAVRWQTNKREPGLLDYMQDIRYNGTNIFIERWRNEDNIPEAVRNVILRHNVLHASASVRRHLLG